MPVFQHTSLLRSSPAEIFTFFSRPANWIQLFPPDFQPQLIEGPEVLSPGAVFALEGRSWGIRQVIRSLVREFDAPSRLILEQVDGPFKKWHDTILLESTADGTSFQESIDYERPGGMLGFMVTNERIRQELEQLFAFRGAVLKQQFGS